MFKTKSKVVSRRQIQRRIKKMSDKAKNDLNKECKINILKTCRFSNDNLTNNLNFLCVQNSDVPCDSNSSSTQTPSTLSVYNNMNNDINNIVFENISSSECAVYDEINEKSNGHLKEITLKSNLQQWACKFNVTTISVNALLQILHPYCAFLPLDYRSLMHTPHALNQCIKLENGDMYYFGIESKILRKLTHGLKEPATSILIQINIDGLPLFKSSSLEVYPILAVCKNFVDNSPFMIAIYSGVGKPAPLDVFLRSFILEVKELRTRGIVFEGKRYTFDIHFFICDAPARAYLKQTFGHTSKLACDRCNIVGVYDRDSRTVNFAQNEIISYPKKKNSDFYSPKLKDYIKNKTPLTELKIKPVTQFPLDPMHLLFLGVLRRLLNFYVAGKKPYKLSQKNLKEIDEKISSINSYIPSDFPRKPRTIKDLKRYKATEFRLLALYTGPTMFYNILNDNNYKHFLLFHCGVFILSNKGLTEKYMNVAKYCFQRFVLGCSDIFGPEFVVYNVHSLLHLIDDVKRYGTLNDFSCFPFENYLSTIKRKVRSKRHVLQQICRRVEEHEKASLTVFNSPVSTCVPKFIYNEQFDCEGSLITYECKKLHCPNYSITVSKPDNCVSLNSGKIILIKKLPFPIMNFCL